MCSKTGVLRLLRFSRRIGTAAIGPIVALALLIPNQSSAQSIELAATQFKINRKVERTSGEYPFWLNRLDCLEDKKYGSTGPDDEDHLTEIIVNPRVSPVGSRYSLQAWAGNGVNCKDSVERQPAGNCWKIMEVIPRVSGTEYPISPRDVLAREVAATDPDICDQEVEWATTFFFFLFQGDKIIADVKWEQTQVDTKAPAPPTTVTASGGDERIYVDWNVTEDAVDVDAEGFRLYCAPGSDLSGSVGGNSSGGSGGTGASGSSGSLGFGGAAGAAPTCTSDDLDPGARPDEATFCGESTGLTSQSASTFYPNPDIQNYQTYAVAVAATDRVGNIGRLSEPACATPEEVIGFFERYKTAGGRAGRGCAFSGAPDTQGAWLGALLAVSLLGWWNRRRRRCV